MISLRDILHGQCIEDTTEDSTNKNFCNEEEPEEKERAEPGETNNGKVHHFSKKNNILENIFMNAVINKSNKSSKNLISRHVTEKRKSEHLSKGEINIFIPERNLSIDQVILQGEAYFHPDQMEINVLQSPMLEASPGVHLNVSVPERKLSFTQVVTTTEEKSNVMTPSRIISVLGVEEEEEEYQGDDMNEMEGPNPGSIDHFQRLFYPRIPCRNCSSCYQKF